MPTPQGIDEPPTLEDVDNEKQSNICANVDAAIRAAIQNEATPQMVLDYMIRQWTYLLIIRKRDNATELARVEARREFLESQQQQLASLSR